MIKLEIFTPKGEIFKSEEITSVTLPSTAGIMSVYEDHKPIIALLTYGEIEVIKKDGSADYIFITSGLLRVDRESKVTVMADTSEFSSEIDVEAAKLAKERAEELIKSATDISEIEFAKLQSDIEREIMKIELGRMRNTSTSSVKVNVTKK